MIAVAFSRAEPLPDSPERFGRLPEIRDEQQVFSIPGPTAGGLHLNTAPFLFIHPQVDNPLPASQIRLFFQAQTAEG
jgi:hypothetical protein